jgi:hypothetical protein
MLKEQLELFVAKIPSGDTLFKTHSYKSPYPPNYEIESKAVMEKFLPDEKIMRKTLALERLTCHYTRCNIDDSDCLLGYPMKLSIDKYGRIEIFPIIEILSYDGYMQLLMESSSNIIDIKSFDNISLRTATGNEFNYWMPIFTNIAVYQKYKQRILNSFSIIQHGIKGKKFKPKQIIKILPCLINNMIVHLQKCVLH